MGILWYLRMPYFTWLWILSVWLLHEEFAHVERSNVGAVPNHSLAIQAYS